MKKLLSLLFASMVACSLAMPVFAADTNAPATTKTAKTSKTKAAKTAKTHKSNKAAAPAPAKTN